MKTSLVLWDWNGTLLNDVGLCVEALNRLLTRHGYTGDYNLDSYRRVFGFPIEDYYRRAGFDLEKDNYSELAHEYMDFYVPASEVCTLTDGAEEALAAIRRAGVRQSVLSASPAGTLRNQVEKRGIIDCFDDLLGLGDIYAKSKLELGREYIARLGVDPQSVIMVGDSEHDFEVAAAIGARPILYAGGHQPFSVLAATGAPVFADLKKIAAAVTQPLLGVSDEFSMVN